MLKMKINLNLKAIIYSKPRWKMKITIINNGRFIDNFKSKILIQWISPNHLRDKLVKRMLKEIAIFMENKTK